MNSSTFPLPVFPLPIFLLPGGITRLRIFEPRYLKMVKLATQANGFAILLNEAERSKLNVSWASWVDIINFDQGDDGMLIIDVKCKALVKLIDVEVDKDNLRHANVTKIEHWPSEEHDKVTKQLSSSLLTVFEQNVALSELYQDTFIDNANWVLARWLELLPIALTTKQVFAAKRSFLQAKSFIQSVVLEP
jgi:hypothetical protein